LNARVCLVTGGAGFIGCAISAGLSARFDRIIAMDSLHEQVHKIQARPAALHKHVELLRLDITDPASWDQLLRDFHPDAVIHLAAETGTGQSITAAARHTHINVTGTAVMLDALARHRRIPARILLASSRAVYGDGAWENPISGEIIYPGARSRDQLARGEWDYGTLRAVPSTACLTKATPASVYGATKLAQEHVIRAWCDGFGTSPAIARLQNVYGPGQSLSNPYTGIVALFCRMARAGKSIPLYEDGKMLRDFVLIDDVVSGLLAVLDAPEIAPHPYDIGTGRAASIHDIGAAIAGLYDAPGPWISGQYRFGDVRHASCKIEATASALAWRPKIQIAEGLSRLKQWIETQSDVEEAMLNYA
jgi:dTDP-L-rhamnose 4-epimerase